MFNGYLLDSLCPSRQRRFVFLYLPVHFWFRRGPDASRAHSAYFWCEGERAINRSRDVDVELRASLGL